MPLSGLPALDLIRPGRVHEATGPARRSFAAVLAGRLSGPVLWIQEGRERDALCPQGLQPFLDPARLLLARPAGAKAVLQVAEEALRSGAAPLVVAELAAAPDLTASRRLQLAAGAGGGGGRGLCLVPPPPSPAHQRSNAAETRWQCTTVAGARTRQLWELVKNKRGKLGCWEVVWEQGAGPARRRESAQGTTKGGGAPGPAAACA